MDGEATCGEGNLKGEGKESSIREEERPRQRPLLSLPGAALGGLISFRPNIGAGNLVEVLAASLGPSTLEVCKGNESLVEALAALWRLWWPQAVCFSWRPHRRTGERVFTGCLVEALVASCLM